MAPDPVDTPLITLEDIIPRLSALQRHKLFLASVERVERRLDGLNIGKSSVKGSTAVSSGVSPPVNPLNSKQPIINQQQLQQDPFALKKRTINPTASSTVDTVICELSISCYLI